MDNHNIECSKPKKSKSCTEDSCVSSQWAYLPSIVLHQIFGLLDAEDRKNASCVCRHWRKSLFHLKWWPTRKFKIEHDNIPKAKFYAATFARIVSDATIALNSLSSTCIYELIVLLRLLNENNRLKSLIIEPSHCRLEESLNSFVTQGGESDLSEILDLIVAILPRLSRFSLGGLEDLAHYSDYILRNLSPAKVSLLGLASVKDDITVYEENYFEPDLISSFKHLHILSIDYDQLSDRFLCNLEGAKHLQRIVVHLHAIPNGHQGTSNMAWKMFKNSHPDCTLRFTVIHACTAIQNLHVQVLREEMPLSHIKVFFCENVNMEMLHNLSTFYARTLRSVIWIDSLSNLSRSWKFTRFVESPDPFVLMSWLCVRFEELVLYGYKYSEDNLVAIGRLRGSNMKNMEIPSIDIVSGGFSYSPDAMKDIAKNLENAWNPMRSDDLHPVILDPNAGDSDEFLLPLVLADLH